MVIPSSFTEFLWYAATLFGSAMLVVIWWVLKMGFIRMLNSINRLTELVYENKVDVTRIKQQLQDHITNKSVHSGDI